jgi:short-subunit dehydrogenase
VELAREGVDVLVVEPGLTETEFHGVAGELPGEGQSAEEVVGAALDALGRQPSVVSGWLNWARANLGSRLLPRALLAHVARDVIERRIPEDMR